MSTFPISYIEPVFRPPSEARSLILQVTNGCSWNRCTFCSMYKSEKFALRTTDEIRRDIDAMAALCRDLASISRQRGDRTGVPSAAARELLRRDPRLQGQPGFCG